MINGEQIIITSLEKPVWEKRAINKYTYLKYLTEIGPLMLPFLKDRLLTVIRFPHGVSGESFYQKNCPDYAPPFINKVTSDNINYIICSNLQTLLWLGNQLALEFHIPFQSVNESNPSEIVFDLDPPSRNEFSLAIEAALILKELFDKLQLTSFIKTSGNKGLQIYLPLNGEHSYEETRLFTSFIAEYITTKHPKWFTTERLKKNRDNRLYIDFLQHAEGKTIIAPYSPRGNEDGLAATPLRWDEVNESLHPTNYTLEVNIDRVKKNILPFDTFHSSMTHQPFRKVITSLTEKG